VGASARDERELGIDILIQINVLLKYNHIFNDIRWRLPFL
jgi:hypothetical protein